MQKPEKLYREKKLLAIVFLFAAAVILLTFIDIPGVNAFHNPIILEL